MESSQETFKTSTEAIARSSKTEERPEKENLNSKSEYLGQRIRRIGLENKEGTIHCETCGLEANSKNTLESHEDKFHTRKTCHDCKTETFGTRALEEHQKSCSKYAQNKPF